MVYNRPRFHCMCMWWRPVIFFFFFWPIFPLIEIFKPGTNLTAPTKSSIMSLPEQILSITHYLFKCSFSSTTSCAHQQLKYYFLFFVFSIASAQKKKKKKFGENRPELTQGHNVQWHRPCTTQAPSSDTNGSPWLCGYRPLELCKQSPWSEFCPTTS